RERRIEIELLSDDVAVAHGERGHLLQAFHEPLGLDAAVRLDVSDDEVGTVGTGGTGGFEHRVGLADAGGGAKEDSQATAGGAGLFGLHLFQQLIGIRPLFGHASVYSCLTGDDASSARFNSSTFTRGSPRKPKVRPRGDAVTSSRTRSGARLRSRAT